MNIIFVCLAQKWSRNLTELSNPSVSNIMKNISAQKVLPGIVAIAAGYTINTRPGPSVATSLMFWPDVCAM